MQLFIGKLSQPEYLTVFGGLLQLEKSLGIKVGFCTVIKTHFLSLNFVVPPTLISHVPTGPHWVAI